MPKYTEDEKRERVKLARKLYENGASIREVAAEIGVCQQSLGEWMRNEGIQMRPPCKRNRIEYDLEELRKWAAMGLGMDEIGVEMNASRTTVRKWLNENNIQISKKPKKLPEKKSVSKPAPRQKKKCKTCRYRSDRQTVNGCDYVWLTGSVRGCPVLGCTKYEKGPRIRRRGERFSLAAG